MGKKRCLLLIQLGGASKGDDIFSFTYNLLSDPEVIRIPGLFRKPLAYLIARMRNNASRKRYARINGSPIMEITKAQARALQMEMDGRDLDVRVIFAARHSEPSIERAVKQAVDAESCVLLPLFPQYSKTTTKTCVDKALEEIAKVNPGIKTGVIKEFHSHPSYIRAQAELIKDAIKDLPKPRAVLFSAHSLPKSHVAAGDPYPKQVARTMELVSRQLPKDCETFLGYQSQLSKRTWIGPSTPDVMSGIIMEGTRNLAVVPIAFVSEHFETLYELDIEYADLAKKLGFRTFKRVQALNTYPLFIKALADLAGEMLLEQDL